MASLNEANVERKFKQVSNTQDSIQSLSLWVIHHKAHHEKIVSIWVKVLKKVSTKQRLTLFYLCNDIVQTCKRKHAIVFKDAFKERLKEAVIQVRDPSIRPNVERIFKIWGERNVYDQVFIDELGDIISNSTSRSVITRFLEEFQPEQALEKIASFEKLESENNLQESVVSTLRLDASNLETIKQLKDRDKGREYSQQFEDGCVKLEVFISNKEIEARERTSLIELLEQSELFYNAQYREAKIVANAYKNFGTRVMNLRKKLDDHLKTLPSPVPSPEPDAPSPEQSPVYTVNEDNTEAIDMEMSDSDNDTSPMVETSSGSIGGGGSRGRHDSTTTTKAYPKPIASITEIHMQHKSRKRKQEDSGGYVPSKSAFFESKSEAGRSNNSDDWKPSKTNSRSKSKSSKNKTQSPRRETNTMNAISVVSQTSSRSASHDVFREGDEGDTTPVKDEHSSTPVQDEGPEDSISSNPIEFLTQLISQTKNVSQNSQPSSFLQSLTGLKPAADSGSDSKDSDSSRTEATPDSWSAWKAAQNTPQPVPAPSPTPYGQSAPPPPPPPPPTYGQPEGVAPPAGYVPPSPQPTPYNQSPAPMMVPPPPYPRGLMPGTNAAPPGASPVSQPPPPIVLPVPPPNVPNWPPPLGGVPMVPPVGPPGNSSSSSMMPPPVSSGFPLPSLHQPPPPPPQAQTQQVSTTPSRPGPGPMRPRANSSNLTEIRVIDEDSPNKEVKVTSPNIPLVGGPARPAFPPVSPGGLHGPRPPTGPPSAGTGPSLRTVSDDQQEFIDKLKRKSSLSSPTSAPANISLQKSEASINLRTLNEVSALVNSAGDQGGSSDKDSSLETPAASSMTSSEPMDTNVTPVSSPDKEKKIAASGESSLAESERPAQRIQSVATRVSRIETMPDRRYDSYSGYDRRDTYGEGFQRDRERDRYSDRYDGYNYNDGYRDRQGDRYAYDRSREPYYRDSYGRSPPKRPPPPPAYDRRPYYPRY